MVDSKDVRVKARIWIALAGALVVILTGGVYLFLRYTLPPSTLTVELDAEGRLSLYAANAVAATERKGGLRWPEHEPGVRRFVLSQMRRSRQNEAGLPECRVRLVLDEKTGAATLFDLLLLCVRQFVIHARVEVGNLGVDVELRRESFGSTPVVKHKDRLFAALSLPGQEEDKWVLTTAKVKPIPPLIELDQCWVGLFFQRLWRGLLGTAVEKNTMECRRLDEIRFDGFDAVLIECTERERAADVVGLLRMLQTDYPDLKTCLLGDASLCSGPPVFE